MKKIILTLFCFCLSYSHGFANDQQTPEKAEKTSQAPTVRVNDYPTQARVEYVLQCMARQKTGENYNTMYGCICAVDKVAETIPYANYVTTATLSQMINTPGEKGGIFRDATGGRQAVRAFREFIAKTERSCGLRGKE